MPLRLVPLVEGEIYHIVNRGVASMPMFIDVHHFKRALETALYYQHNNPPLKYSYFIRMPQSIKSEIFIKLGQSKDYLVEIISYCFMPNHVHFLLKQLTENGITDFMRKFSSSYTHYFNIKNKRLGPLFQGRFKAVRIETEQQLLHVSRYIHLNPYSSGIVKTITGLKDYFYSSLPEYLGNTKYLSCQKEIILNYFRKPGAYEDFVFRHADHQKSLSIIKHLLLENLETE